MYDGTRDTPAESSAALTGKRRATIRWRSVDELLTGASFADEPTVIIANGALLERFDGLRTTPEHVVVVAADAATAIALGGRADVVTANVPDPTAQDHLLDAACCLAAARFENAHLKRELARVDDEYGELSRIGIALMHERDRVALLNLIVAHGKRLTESDGGGVLLLDTDEHGAAQLRPVVFKLDSLPDVSLPDGPLPGRQHEHGRTRRTHEGAGRRRRRGGATARLRFSSRARSSSAAMDIRRGRCWRCR